MWWSTLATRALGQIYTSRDLFKSKYVAYKKIHEASKVLIILKGAKYWFQSGERIFLTLFQIFINFLKGNFKGNMSDKF